MGNVPQSYAPTAPSDVDEQQERGPTPLSAFSTSVTPFLLQPYGYEIPSQPFAPPSKQQYRKNHRTLQRMSLFSRLKDSPRTFVHLSPYANSMTILQRLIVLQDWQRVLCRFEIYPEEIHQYIPIYINDVTVTIPEEISSQSPKSSTQPEQQATIYVTPLHLICALDPPLLVVTTILRIGGTDIASLPVRPTASDATTECSSRMNPSKSFLWRRRHKHGPQGQRTPRRNVPSPTSQRQRRLLQSRNQVVLVTDDRRDALHDDTDDHSHLSNALSSTSSHTYRDLLRTTTSGSSTSTGWKTRINIRFSFDKYKRRVRYAVRHRHGRGGAFPMVEGDDEDLDDEEICDDETNAHAAYNDRTSETVWLQQQQQQQQSSPPKLSLLAGSVAASPPWTAEQCSQSHSSFSSTTTPTRIGDNETARSAGNVILQLSSTGGVHPVPLCVATATGAPTTQEEKRKPSTVLHEGAEGLIPEDNVVDDKSENGTDPVPIKLESVLTTATNSFFRVHWDFDPLLQHVRHEGSLLALHIACFYSASAEVLNALVEAHPLAALSDVVGMLPIHFVAAGWSIQPLLPPPSTLIPTLIPQHIPSPTSCSEGGPLERLKVLQRVVPDSVRVRSGNHGMTPVDYIHECMDEGSYKETCLRILQQGLISTTKDSSPFLQIDTSTTNSSDGVCSFVDTTNSSAEDVTDNSGEMYQAYSHGSESSFSCLSTLVAERNWERLLTELELNPSLASKWTFGVDPASASIYKRLPLHCACAYGAPIGLISNLIQCHPDGAAAIDARDISTPLSLACFAGASVAIIRLLLYTYPKAIAIENAYGQVPLHVAVLSKVCYDTIELLVEQSPHLVLLSDNDGQSPINYAKKIYGEKDPVYHFLVMIELVLQNEADTI